MLCLAVWRVKRRNATVLSNIEDFSFTFVELSLPKFIMKSENMLIRASEWKKTELKKLTCSYDEN